MSVTPKSDLAARAAAVIPGGVNSGQRRVPGLEELVIAATSGATFTDGDGNTYTDYHAAFGPPLLGHNDPDVDAARAATGRRHVLKFQGCYHGWHDSVAMNVISLPENMGKKDPLSKGVLPEVT